MGCVVSCLSVLQKAELLTSFYVFRCGFRYHVSKVNAPSPKIESKWALLVLRCSLPTFFESCYINT